MILRDAIKLIEADYPPEMIDVELRGFFPDYGMSMFPLGHVQACTDAALNDEMEEAIRPEDNRKPAAGFNLIEWPRVGPILFEMPKRNNSLYVIAGDPGVDMPPKRNAAVVMVIDVTVKPHTVVYFHWVPGRGSYHPFMESYKYALGKYLPVAKGMDTTGPQKALDELGFQDFDLVIDAMNFGALKEAMLNSLLIDVTSHNLRWPRIQGLLTQMSTYKRGEDKNIPQDIVMTLAMLSWLSRSVNDGYRGDAETPHANYHNRKQRSSVSSRRR